MDTAAGTPAASPILKNIAVDQLQPNPWNRTVFDPQAMAELVASVRAVGITEPLLVRPLPAGGDKGGGEMYQIASGHRRWLAAQQAGLKEVPCLVQEISDREVAQDNILINVQRENVPPLELARMVQNFMIQFGMSQKEVAKSFGKDPTWVSHLLRFSELDPELKKMSALIFSWPQLQALRSLPPTLQRQIAQELQSSALKPENLQKRCNQLLYGSKSKRPVELPNTEQDDQNTPDPLSRDWEDVEGAMAGWTWSAEHTQPLNWRFDVNLEPLYPKDVKKTLGQFFLAMATAMGETQPDPEVRQQLRYNTEAADLGRQMAKAALDSHPEPQEYPALEAMRELGDNIGEFVTEKKKERAAAGLSEEPTKEEQDRFAEEFLAKHGKLR